MSPRRLTFAVGTSLLTASLATVACADKTHVNVRPPQPEEHVNEGPEPEQAPEQTAPEQPPDSQDSPEPQDNPDAPEFNPDATVNVRHADPE
jgi:hypothetical protein